MNNDGSDDDLGPELDSNDGAGAPAAAEGGEPRKRRRRRRRRDDGGPTADGSAQGARDVSAGPAAGDPSSSGSSSSGPSSGGSPSGGSSSGDGRPRRAWRGDAAPPPATPGDAPTTDAIGEASPPPREAAAASVGTLATRDAGGRRERRRRGESRGGEPRGEANRAEPNRGEANRADANRSEPNRGEPNRADARHPPRDPNRPPREARGRDGGGRDGGGRDGGGRDGGGRDGGRRDSGGRDGGGRGRSRDARPEGAPPREASTSGSAAATVPTAVPSATTYEAPTVRLEARRGVAPSNDDIEEAADASVAWGSDDAGPAPAVVLAADLPANPPVDEDDPVSLVLLDAPDAGRALGDDVASITGVRFVVGGRVQWFDAGEIDYTVGERVVVDVDRSTRVGWIAVPPARKSANAYGGRNLRRVIRRAGDADLQGELAGEADRQRLLRAAKDLAARLRLPMKVYRVEVMGQLGRGAKLNVYYTSDERMDLRELVRELGMLGGRVELRQLGVRDEAKAVGGIGSCGLTLCCTTWLPDFVPVSIKMAKDQGLVLSPTKVSGQCGRLKCCLVYEQAGYAELRKGLPKLGKRVVAPRGEGRVVEVDVLRQRIRVSYGAGDTEVLPAADVKSLFPSGNPAQGRAPGDRRGPRPGGPGVPGASADEGEADDEAAEDTDDPRALAQLAAAPVEIDPAPSLPVDDGPTDDPSSDDFANIDGPTDDPSSANYRGGDDD